MCGIVVETLEAAMHFRWDFDVAGFCEVGGLRKFCDGKDARHDRNIDAGPLRTLEEPRKRIDIEKKLGDGAGRACIDLPLERIDVSRAHFSPRDGFPGRRRR